jgi:hypothetical protein
MLAPVSQVGKGNFWMHPQQLKQVEWPKRPAALFIVEP